MRSCELLWEQLRNDGRRADKQVEELLQVKAMSGNGESLRSV